MIKLVKNEYKKNYNMKHNILIILTIITITLIYKYSQNINIFLDTLTYIPSFIALIISFSASSIISKEISEETFKTYLTKPKKRSKILLSKIIYLLLLTIFYQLLTITIYLVIILLTKQNITLNDFIKIIKQFISYTPPIYFIIFFTTFLSVIIKNSKLTITISTILLITSTSLSELFLSITWNFIEYTFLPYLDYTIFNNPQNITLINNIYNINLTQTNGIIILSTYSIIFLILSIIIFNRKDIIN